MQHQQLVLEPRWIPSGQFGVDGQIGADQRFAVHHGGRFGPHADNFHPVQQVQQFVDFFVVQGFGFRVGALQIPGAESVPGQSVLPGRHLADGILTIVELLNQFVVVDFQQVDPVAFGLQQIGFDPVGKPGRQIEVDLGLVGLFFLRHPHVKPATGRIQVADSRPLVFRSAGFHRRPDNVIGEDSVVGVADGDAAAG